MYTGVTLQLNKPVIEPVVEPVVEPEA